MTVVCFFLPVCLPITVSHVCIQLADRRKLQVKVNLSFQLLSSISICFTKNSFIQRSFPFSGRKVLSCFSADIKSSWNLAFLFPLSLLVLSCCFFFFLKGGGVGGERKKIYFKKYVYVIYTHATNLRVYSTFFMFDIPLYVEPFMKCWFICQLP